MGCDPVNESILQNPILSSQVATHLQEAGNLCKHRSHLAMNPLSTTSVV